MSSEKEHEVEDRLSKFLLDVIIRINPPGIPGCYASIESLHMLHAYLISLRDFLFAAAKGDLSGELPYQGFISGTLQTLQAHLRHLTWQTQMVASGDFSQRVEFMGEFSESFNAMVVQLDQTLKELKEKEAALTQTNKELRNEIAIRKKIEMELRESREALRILAITDPLTGLYNRRHFYRLAEIEISKSLRYARPLSVMMYDIDSFKSINDTFGHPCGDMVLKMVADVAKKKLRAADILARYGGEEFIVLLPETSAPEAAILGERMRKQIENTIIHMENQQISVTASFGVSDWFRKLERADYETRKIILSEFISGADRALYASKNAGRNRVTIVEPGETELS